jgi:hypothetical protein
MERAIALSNLANALLGRAWASATDPVRPSALERKDVDEAIDVAREAARGADPGTDAWGQGLASQATALRTR